VPHAALSGSLPRGVLARVPRGSAEMVAAATGTIFAQPTSAEVTE
jgi:hypothetical protein